MVLWGLWPRPSLCGEVGGRPSSNGKEANLGPESGVPLGETVMRTASSSGDGGCGRGADTTGTPSSVDSPSKLSCPV
jgi:hypothetical protein